MSPLSNIATQGGLASRASTEDRWGKALGNLKNKDLLVLEVDDRKVNKREVLVEVLSIVRRAEQLSQEKRWKWRNKRTGEIVIIRDLFAKMTTWVEKFKSVGDSIVQYDPGHAALPWAAARFVLQAAVNDIQMNGAMIEGLELVFHLITKFEVVENLYLGRPSSLHTQLDESIIALYSAILEYLIEAHRYFTQKTSVRISKSVFQLEDMQTKYVPNIQAKSNKVDEYIRLISGEMIHDLLERDEVLEITLKELDEPIKRMCSSIVDIQDRLKEEERLQIFDWLSSIEYNNHHRTKAKGLMSESGKWLLKKSEFQHWMSSSTSSVLWLHGIPGSGKSMLVAHVIEYIKTRNAREMSPAPLAYFYCSRNATEPERADPTELLRCILEQLSCSDQDLPIRLPVVEAYQLRRKEARGRMPGKLDLEDTVKLLLDLLETNPAVIVIDALDECDPARRQELLNALQTIIKESNNVVKIFISSRDDHDLVNRLSRSPNLYIDSSQNTEDITKFVTSRVRDAIRKEKILCGRVPSKLRDEIISALIGKAKGMFRLVSLHIDNLCDPTRVKTRANVLQVLANLPPDLEKSYDYIIAQITSSQKPNPEIASRVFKWLLAARQQLTSQTFILAVCAGMDNMGLISPFDILSVCSNLVLYDEDTDSFRFAHLSVVEYLEKLEEYSPTASNAFCAEQCLSWIINRGETQFTGSDFNIPIARAQYSATRKGKKRPLDYRPYSLSEALFVSVIQSFASHADLEWGEYARRAGKKRTKSPLRNLLETFLLNAEGSPRINNFELWMDRLPTGSRTSGGQLVWDPDLSVWRDLPKNASNSSVYDYDFIKARHKSPLFAACAFDLAEVVATLLKEIPRSNEMETDSEYTCMIIAADCNSVATIGVLIAESSRLNMSVSDWHRPLYGAACNSHFQVVQSILDHVGRGFFTQFYLLGFVRRLFSATAVQQNYEKTLLLLLNNNSEFCLNEEVLLEVFRNKFHDGRGIARTLLLSKKKIEITRRIFNSSFINPYCGQSLMDGLLTGQDTVRSLTADAFLDLLRSAGPERMSLLRKRGEYQKLKHNKNIGQPFRRHAQLFEIASTAIAKVIDFRKGLSEVLISQTDDAVVLTWENLLLLERFEKPTGFMQCILQSRPDMSQATINFLLASWDEDVVKELLKFHRIKVTKDIIKIVAFNTNHGEKVMRLLLDTELEEMNL